MTPDVGGGPVEIEIDDEGWRELEPAAEALARQAAQATLGEAASREGEAFSAAGLLGSDQGRAFLFLDAAIAETV